MNKYNIENYIHYEEKLGIYDYLKSSKFINELRDLDFETTVIRENREIDEISLEVYDTELLWWVITIYNNIIDPLDLPSNLILYVPSKSDIEKLFLNYQDS